MRQFAIYSGAAIGFVAGLVTTILYFLVVLPLLPLRILIGFFKAAKRT